MLLQFILLLGELELLFLGLRLRVDNFGFALGSSNSVERFGGEGLQTVRARTKSNSEGKLRLDLLLLFRPPGAR